MPRFPSPAPEHSLFTYLFKKNKNNNRKLILTQLGHLGAKIQWNLIDLIRYQKTQIMVVYKGNIVIKQETERVKEN
jgi:hypothetical protein